jgi:hypothetical protein
MRYSPVYLLSSIATTDIATTAVQNGARLITHCLTLCLNFITVTLPSLFCCVPPLISSPLAFTPFPHGFNDDDDDMFFGPKDSSFVLVLRRARLAPEGIEVRGR